MALKTLGEYLAVGGMPESVKKWCETKDIAQCLVVSTTIIKTYRQDFNKYAKKHELKYVRLLFNQIPKCLGQKFKFSKISGEHRKNELAPCLDLLETAGIVTPVVSSAGNGIPLGAEIDFDDFKLIFLDIALSQVVLGLKNGRWITDPLKQFVNKGALVEAFIGQELLAYSNPLQTVILPVEVKSGSGTTIKSLHAFLEKHPQSPYGIRYSTQNYSVHEKIHSYPLYAIIKIRESGGSIEE
jgi:hypothetical protein